MLTEIKRLLAQDYGVAALGKAHLEWLVSQAEELERLREQEPDSPESGLFRIAYAYLGHVELMRKGYVPGDEELKDIADSITADILAAKKEG